MVGTVLSLTSLRCHPPSCRSLHLVLPAAGAIDNESCWELKVAAVSPACRTCMILYQVALTVLSVLARLNRTPAGPYAEFMTAI